jgi:hypothetical protein
MVLVELPASSSDFKFNTGCLGLGDIKVLFTLALVATI